MATRAEVLAAFEAADAASVLIAEISASGDLDRRKELVDARRELAQRMLDVSMLAAHYAPLRNDEKLWAEGNRRFAAMRQIVVDHQVAWPAAAIAADLDAFVEASAAVTQSGRDFSTWFRQTIASLPDAE